MTFSRTGLFSLGRSGRRLAAPLVAALLVSVSLPGCMRYLTHDRSKVLLEGVDIDQTIAIAGVDLRRGGIGSILTVWAIRDQVVTPAQAGRIADLYLAYADSIQCQKFSVWHLTWAIADLYRNGNDDVKRALQKAFDDAKVRVKTSYGLADRFVNSDILYMGDAHSLGRAYAVSHVVVPGNKKYVQSYDDYMRIMSAK